MLNATSGIGFLILAASLAAADTSFAVPFDHYYAPTVPAPLPVNGLSASDGFALSWPNGVSPTSARLSFPVQRYDASGALLWARTFPHATTTSGRAVAFGRDTFVMTASQLARVADSGLTLWTMPINASADRCSLIVASDGQTYVLANDRIVSFSPDGEQLWERSLESLGGSGSLLGVSMGPVASDGVQVKLRVVTSERLVRISRNGSMLWEAASPAAQAPMQVDRRDGTADVGVVAGTFFASWVGSPGQTLHQVSLPSILFSSAAQAVEPDGGLSSVVAGASVRVIRHGPSAEPVWEQTFALPANATYRFGHLPADSNYRVVYLEAGDGPRTISLADVAQGGTSSRSTAFLANSVESLVVSAGSRSYVAVDGQSDPSAQRVLSLDVDGVDDFAVDVPGIPAAITPVFRSSAVSVANGETAFLVNVGGDSSSAAVMRVDFDTHAAHISGRIYQARELLVDGGRNYVASGSSTLTITAMDEDGTIAWSVPLNVSVDQNHPVVVEGDGLWVAGKSNSNFHVVRVTGDGTVASELLLDREFFDVPPALAVAGDALLLAGYIDQGGGDRCAIAMVDSGGDVLWEAVIDAASSERCMAVLTDASEPALVAAALGGSKSGVNLRQVDAAGNVLQLRRLDLGVYITSVSLARFGDMAYAFGQFLDLNQGEVGIYVARFDPASLDVEFSARWPVPLSSSYGGPSAIVDGDGISVAVVMDDPVDGEGPLLARWTHQGELESVEVELFGLSDRFAGPATPVQLPNGRVGVAYGLRDPATGVPSIRATSFPAEIHANGFEAF